MMDVKPVRMPVKLEKNKWRVHGIRCGKKQTEAKLCYVGLARILLFVPELYLDNSHKSRLFTILDHIPLAMTLNNLALGSKVGLS